jgi:predicted metal-dependent phosphoesterase TrpH
MSGWTLVQHMHTRHSFDSLTEPRLLVQRAEELGIDVIAVTDHGTWQGSVEARECAEAAGSSST